MNHDPLQTPSSAEAPIVLPLIGGTSASPAADILFGLLLDVVRRQ